jgi:hypothetical protein
MTDSNSSFQGRRAMLKRGLLRSASFRLEAPTQERAAAVGAGRDYLSVREFGAKGDGHTDDTKAIQCALDAAGEVQGAVFVPPGVYRAAELRMHPNTALVAIPSWHYETGGGATLQLSTGAARCLLYITRATVVYGLALEGASLGNGVHGIFLDNPEKTDLEDSILIQQSRVAYFTGDGVNLTHPWVYSVRHAMFGFNGGDGVKVRRGWDGFVTDNWFAINHGVGFSARDDTSSLTFTANRIEWNGLENMLVLGGSAYQITGNLFDFAGTCGLALRKRGDRRCTQMTITGNPFRASGKYADASSFESCHLLMEEADGVTCVGNNFQAEFDEYYGRTWSPVNGIVCRSLRNSVIVNNVLHEGAMRQLIIDQGGHAEGVVLKDNPGSLLKAPL